MGITVASAKHFLSLVLREESGMIIRKKSDLVLNQFALNEKTII